MPLIIEAAQALLDGLGSWQKALLMLGDLPWDAGMLDGFQAKVSLLARRKSTSMCSYLADS